MDKSFAKYEGNDRITPIQIDVSKEDQVKKAAEQGREKKKKKKI